MAGKPLTSEAIALTEKKMDMALDDIIKMSSSGTSNTKAKKQRVSNRNQKFSNNVVHNRSMKFRQFMDTRSTLRQGALAQRRSSLQGNQFPLAAEAAKKAAIAPIRNKNYNWTRAVPMYKPRVAAPPVQNGAARGGFAMKQVKVVSKQRPQTLDSLFASMKEQRMKVLSQQNNNNRRSRNGGGGQQQQQQQQHRPRPPWARFNN